MENRGPHVGLSRHESVFPGTSVGHFNYPWDQGGRSHGKSWNGLCPVPRASETSPGQCQGSCHCQIGFRFTAKGLLWVVDLSLPPRPGVLRSLPVGNRASSWKEEKACPQRGSCVWSFLAGSRPASGRLECHLGVPVQLEGVPRNPSGLLSVLLLPDSRIHPLECSCFCCPAGGGPGRGLWVTVRPPL